MIRFRKETQRLMQEPVPGISATPDESNARYFHVLVCGPSEVCLFTFLIHSYSNQGYST
jgi:hypothetical protein